MVIIPPPGIHISIGGRCLPICGSGGGDRPCQASAVAEDHSFLELAAEGGGSDHSGARLGKVSLKLNFQSVKRWFFKKFNVFKA